MDHLKLTSDKLSVEEISDLVGDDGCGAISLFVGTTRDNFEGKKVVCLEYEAYESMALKAMKSICEDIRNTWPNLHNIAIYHRVGVVPTREASVVVAASSPHRRDAIDAVSRAIDQLKATVPIWKKEVYEGDAPVWKENKECLVNKEGEDEPSEVDSNMVQINVSSEEIQNRIQSFMQRKREQVNISNIQDFIPSKRKAGAACQAEGDEDTDTCARVRTQFVKRSDSKGHLKIHRVTNAWGPQTVKEVDSGSGSGVGASSGTLPPAIAERVRGVEQYLNVGPVAPDVYRRLKAVEDRLAHLQSVSPEYAHFWHRKDLDADSNTEREMDFAYTADDIVRKIEMLEKRPEL